MTGGLPPLSAGSPSELSSAAPSWNAVSLRPLWFKAVVGELWDEADEEEGVLCGCWWK